MTHYLLSAEADKIQDFVFRSAHLREVVGGSQLLTWFCKEAAPALLAATAAKGQPPPNLLISDGGSFTIDFADKAQALRFGRALPDLYRRATGGSLTVAPLAEWSGDERDFKAANDASRARLNLAKRASEPPAAGEHMPYAAICESCGIELAATYAATRPGERGKTICADCQRKASQDPRFVSRRFKERFLQDGRGKSFESEAVEETATKWDRRGYVAYLVADGNGMGRLFGKCRTRAQLKELSERLSEYVMDALGVPAQKLMALAADYQGAEDLKVPAMPLILGGDDVFVRMPAPFALDFARRFCLEYEKLMAPLAEQIEREAADAAKAEGKPVSAPVRPTMSAAVVICKAKYPHYLAHRYGEALLKEAKQQSKRFAAGGRVFSCVNFGVFLGSRLEEGVDADAPYRPTMKPYWVGDAPPDMGLNLETLLDARAALDDLPRGRLAELEALFDAERIPTRSDDVAEVARWDAAFEQLAARVALRSSGQADDLGAVMASFRRTASGNWRLIHRPGGKTETFHAQALPDLLDAWEYSLKLPDATVAADKEG